MVLCGKRSRARGQEAEVEPGRAHRVHSMPGTHSLVSRHPHQRFHPCVHRSSEPSTLGSDPVTVPHPPLEQAMTYPHPVSRAAVVAWGQGCLGALESSHVT